MRRFSRFHRRARDAAAAPATETSAPPSPTPAAAAAAAAAAPSPGATPEDKTSGSRTPSPAAQSVPPPPPRLRDKQTRSPLLGLHLRATAKRARESPPASLPQSPNATLHVHDDEHKTHISSPLSAPLPARQDARRDEAETPSSRPRIPSFLMLSAQGAFFRSSLSRQSLLLSPQADERHSFFQRSTANFRSSYGSSATA